MEKHEVQEPMINNAEKPVGVGIYIGLIVLFSIPIVGLIASIVMIFVAKNQNIKNFAIAALIWIVLGYIFTAILVAIGALISGPLTDYINIQSDGEFGSFREFFGQYLDVFDYINPFK